MHPVPLVFVVDDDAAVRASLVSLLESDGYQVQAFACARDFLATPLPLAPTCLILDMHMPALDGMEVVAELARVEAGIPVIFLTGFGSIPMSVQAIKAGATEFLTKPVQPEQLLDAVRMALEADLAALAQRSELAALRQRHASLTPRERETLALVIGGLLNKQVADAMGISEIMAKTHKRKVMEKMAARSLPDLVRSCERLQIVSSRHR
ncbi:response regulator transcription factor [Massilia sp. S19_KUP03_FR1]|uniref:response regulator transcription factor n=1 Tax=Massilia sp. S19_KUP03_FR1 TaxID=3025503 RepID=UPI002FCD222C